MPEIADVMKKILRRKAEEITERAQRVATAPEIPESEREALVRGLLFADGLMRILTGDLDEGGRILDRLRALPDVDPSRVEWLEREVAVARGDAAAASAPLVHIPASCFTTLARGRWADLAGDRGAAAALFAPLFTEPVSCAQRGEMRFLQAYARVVLAEDARARGDGLAAATHLGAFHRLLPAPDEDLPLVRRARALAGAPE